MTEQEYIDATNLAKVRAASRMLDSLDIDYKQMNLTHADWQAAKSAMARLEKSIYRYVQDSMEEAGDD